MTATRIEIAVTGTGLVSCLGPDAPTAWANVCANRDMMRPFTQCESRLAPDRVGGEAPAPPADVLPEAVREVRLLRTAINEAMTQARLKGPQLPRTAVVVGTTLHGMRRAGEFLRGGDASLITACHAAPALAGALVDLGIDGPNLSNCSACSSGLGSVALGVTLLEAGIADVVLAGGYDPVSEYAIGGFASLRLLAREALRPFSRHRDGMVLSEAYAVLVLERTTQARTRGATILAQVAGFGESADAHHLTQPHPGGVGAARAIRASLADAGVDAGGVSLIAAHATGTPNNDAAEYAALREVFGGHLARTGVVAFKSHLGHSLGAAGAAELVLSLHALRAQVLPPTARTSQDELEFPDLKLRAAPTSDSTLRTTLNLSLGFGGANTAVVLTREPQATAPPGLAPRPDHVRDVLITGVGVVLPGIVGTDALRTRLLESSAITGDTGPVPEHQYSHLVNARRVRRLSEYVKVTLAAATAACADANITDVPAFMADCSAILGTMGGSTAFSLEYYRGIVERGIDDANPMLFAEGVPNAGAAHLSMMLSIRGGCQSIIGSRTAGLDALGLAWARIATGRWERAIVSAGEEYSDLVNRVLNRCGLRADPPGGPFGPARGSAIGAGAVAFILESRHGAESRGVRARGLVKSWTARSCAHGLNSDGGTAAVAGALRALGSPRRVISSANGSWVDGIERAGMASTSAGEGLTVSSPVGHVAETLSATPLVGLAAFLAAGTLPALRSDNAALPDSLKRSDGHEPVRDACILCTDPAGLASAVRVALPHS